MAPRQRCLSSSPTEDSSFDSSESLLSEHNQKLSPSTRRKSPPQSLLNQTESDIARDKHDYFNLVALAFIVFTSGLNYELPWLSYKGGYFWVNWATTILYFFLDLVWVAKVPICVKSPDVIIKHHIVAMLYLFAPVVYPEYRWFMGAILSVEINTWFLICRRLVYRNNGPVGTTSTSNNNNPSLSPAVHPILATTVSAMFYITWILIRCYLYPSYLIMFVKMADERIRETGVFFHNEMIFIVVHSALCVLNLKWTYDLFTPIIKRWLGMGPKTVVVQNGL
mmetsp:Transcript_29394/g.55136  ORF Transcript_29394/g.55136 Transcript_29394/m.55136 type:complete len:280 (+) Transcript_29394:69-908(+)